MPHALPQVISDMSTVNNIYADYGEQPDQGAIQTQGNTYLKKDFPKMTFFTETKIVIDGATTAAAPLSASTDNAWHGA
jgi:hypothetical protein